MEGMSAATWAKLLALGIALGIAALAAAAQASLFHINRNRLRGLVESGLPRAQAIVKVFNEPGWVFLTIQLLEAFGTAGVVVSVILLALEVADPGPWIVLGLVAGLVALLVVQIAARAVAVVRSETTALALLGPLSAFGVVFAPLLLPLRGLERLGLRLLGRDQPTEPSAVAEEELRILVESVDDSTALEEDEREMIHGIFEMSHRPAREVMVPRIDMVAESADASVRQVVDRVVSSGYSRIPIYQDTPDSVVGIVYAKDILRHLREGTLDDPVAPIARPPYFVPDTKKVDELLEDLQQKRVHVAIVVDEYGGTAGLLTIEDLIEEIVGEIRDEYDVNEEQPIQTLSDHEAVVDARIPLRDVNEALHLHLNTDEFDTLGGLVYHELGKVPVDGDEIRVNGCLVSVISTQGRRLKKLRVTLVDDETG